MEIWDFFLYLEIGWKRGGINAFEFILCGTKSGPIYEIEGNGMWHSIMACVVRIRISSGGRYPLRVLPRLHRKTLIFVSKMCKNVNDSHHILEGAEGHTIGYFRHFLRLHVTYTFVTIATF